MLYFLFFILGVIFLIVIAILIPKTWFDAITNKLEQLQKKIEDKLNDE